MSADYERLVARAGAARFVLVGEATHGTHEFYRERAELTKRLTAEHGFTVVAVEADRPDAYRVNRFVRGESDDESPEEALGDFRRFPAWMWRNTEVAEFVGWLREWNDGLEPDRHKVGFYGLDLYSLRSESWSLRDGHMVETLDELVRRLERNEGPTKAVVWAHNSHLGDARATEVGVRGDVNVGRLVRERHGDAAFLVGFTTYTGTVTAASEWGGLAESKRLRPAVAGSWEERFHQTGAPRLLLNPVAVDGQRLERGIGVIYRPETERFSHYFPARLGDQFDALIHIDETRALEPLELESPHLKRVFGRIHR